MKKLLPYSERLKHLPRTGWLVRGIAAPETVAAHSWQMALVALQLSVEYAGDYDFNKVIKLCLCHDLAESIIGDITPCEAAYETKAEKEAAAMVQLAADAAFPEAALLFNEYEAQITPEAQLANDLDQLDLYAQSLDYEQKYPEKDLTEFRTRAAAKIKTPLGKKLLKELIS